MARASYPKLSSARMKGCLGPNEAPRPGTNKVEILGTMTRLDLNPDRVLSASLGQVTDVMVVGWDKDGELFLASSHAQAAELLWLLEKAKEALLAGA